MFQGKAGIYQVELIKNIATIVGCITACITLVGILIRPISKRVNAILSKIEELDAKISDSKEHSAGLAQQIEDVDLKSTSRFERLEKIVLENEADRIRTELFACGSRCRRGIRLHPEEYDHIRNIYYKYSEVLKKNHEGEVEFNYITDFYNSQSFPQYHKEEK